MDQEIDRSLALHPSRELSAHQTGESRILGAMIQESLAVVKDAESEAEKLAALVREAKRIQDSVAGMTPNNVKAYHLLLRAAQAGHAEAQYELALCFSFSIGTGSDQSKGHYWIRQSAEQGFDEAQHKMGNWARGSGKFAESAEWYRKAAEQGHSEAQSILSNCYATGTGVPQNYCAAYAWAQLVADAEADPDGGNAWSQHEATSIASWLSTSQLEEAQKLFQDFKQKFSAKR